MPANFILTGPALAFTSLLCSTGTVSVVYFVALNECLLDDQLQRLSCLVSTRSAPNFSSRMLFIRKLNYLSEVKYF